MRLIDADALMKLVQKTHCTGCNNYNKVKCRACDIGDMLDYLDDAPTVDLWHYPSRGELPEKDTKCLVHTIADNYYVALIDSSDKCWCTGEMFEKILRPGDIDRWQYIEPPKEEATVKCCENCGHYKNNVCERTKTHPNKPKEWLCLDWEEE